MWWKRLLVVLAALALTGCGVWLRRSSVPGSTMLATQGDQASGAPSLSQTGRFVAFESSATNLIASDTNGVADVFVRDHVAKTTERVSVATGGTQANGASHKPAISDDGRYVAFETEASNLFTGDTDGKTDIVVRDRQLGATTVVSIAPNGSGFVDDAVDAAISGDGRIVSFTVRVPFMSVVVPTGPYVREVAAGATRVMPPVGGGFALNGRATLSDNGGRIAYGHVGAAAPPIGDAPYGAAVADTSTGAVIATVAGGSLSHQAANYFDLALSGDGTKVVFLFASATSTTGNLYAFDLANPVLIAVPGSYSFPGQPAISRDGTVVALRAAPSGQSGYFLTDLAGATPRLVSANSTGTPAASVDGTALSGDGQFVSFGSTDPDLISGDTNGVSDVFTRGTTSTGPS